MHTELAFPDVHRDVLDLAGKGDTGIVEQDVEPSVRRPSPASTTSAQFCSDVTSRCR